MTLYKSLARLAIKKAVKKRMAQDRKDKAATEKMLNSKTRTNQQESKSKKTTRIKICFTNYICFLIMLLGLVSMFSGAGIILIWPILFIILFRKSGKIKKIITQGKTVKGVILKRNFFRHGCIFKYAYQVNNKKYIRKNIVRKYSTEFKKDDKVKVKYNSRNPKKSVIFSLYS